MGLYYDLPVYRDTYQMILKIFEVAKDFVNMKVVSFKKQAELTVLMDSIGKQVTGWHYASQLNAGIAVVMVTASEHAFFKRDKGIVLAQLSNRNARHLALIKTPL